MKFMGLVGVIISKACIESKAAIEEPGCMLVELLANEEACVKAATIEVFENMVDKFGEENIRHPDIVGAKSSPENKKRTFRS